MIKHCYFKNGLVSRKNELKQKNEIQIIIIRIEQVLL